MIIARSLLVNSENWVLRGMVCYDYSKEPSAS